jgi:hypothetical protein
LKDASIVRIWSSFGMRRLQVVGLFERGQPLVEGTHTTKTA